ncbi:hypothetical protein N7508_010136 [Penicillium antarcticum]|uniref:uncharacterized protein n=1 Tax=Penicillium antarcticum TaxID=416450 RepID=UPI0023866B48|nr:uncharacterized protein N7508_010136 [Penicillium antarcticum]KAJ5295315.1 hypothetical protein N7508_010136 [Penicillium antarcticum]
MQGDRAMSGKFVQVTEEVEEFLYGSGEILLNGTSTRRPNFGMATNYDLFEPEYTQPNVTVQDLTELGIVHD